MSTPIEAREVPTPGRLSTTDLALIGAFAAIISACAYIGAI